MKRKFRNGAVVAAAVIVVFAAIQGPELLAKYQDRSALNKITVLDTQGENEGYRYSLSSNEKLYILSKCLDNQVLPETELSALTRTEGEGVEYREFGTYAFVVNRQETFDREIGEGEIFEVCNREMELLKELGVMPEEVKEVHANSYSAELYSAIDVLEPRNNLAVWKVSLSTGIQNADKHNRLLDAYIDADTGKIYEFYARTKQNWEDMNPKQIVEQWSGYLGLTGREDVSYNPLLETTPYFEKYRFPAMKEEGTLVTVGFYEGINEMFLKISG